MQDYRKLEVWQKAHQLTLAVYRASAGFPSHELYGLTSQMRRASLSIGSNIAEGCGRDSQMEMAHFLRIAQGSASELDYQLLIARDLGYLPAAEYEPLHKELASIRRMLYTLTQKVKSSSIRQPKTKN